MIATERYFPSVLFIVLCKLVLTFESVGEILKCGHSNVQKLSSSTLLCCCFIMLCKFVLIFESVDEILKCDHSHESY